MSEWLKILDWLKENNKDVFDSLQRNDSLGQPINFNTLPMELPDSFLEMYSHYNGQSDGYVGGIFMDFRIRPSEYYVPGFLAHLSEDYDSEPAEESPVLPVNSIKDVYLSNKWLDFASNSAGRYLALDFDPGPSGHVGQVISYGMDFMPRFVLARNFDQFLQRIWKSLHDGEFIIKRYDDGIFTWVDKQWISLDESDLDSVDLGIPSEEFYNRFKNEKDL